MKHGHLLGLSLGLLCGFAFASDLPTAVDNSETPYFFRGYDQGESGACASISRITMSLGYERNAYYKVTADSSKAKKNGRRLAFVSIVSFIVFAIMTIKIMDWMMLVMISILIIYPMKTPSFRMRRVGPLSPWKAGCKSA